MMRLSRLRAYFSIILFDNYRKIGPKPGFFVWLDGSAGHRSTGVDNMTDLDSIFIDIGRAAWAWWIANEDEKLYQYELFRNTLLALEYQYPCDDEIRHLEVLT